ncbi:MAG: hypothetical protein HFH19_08890 [Ruminococcus sp.]|nr:hypothetical protein [Ruminococcus sp.]
MKSEIKSLPTVALRGMTIMPEMVVHFDISRERSIAAVQEAMVEDQKIFRYHIAAWMSRNPFPVRHIVPGKTKLTQAG